MEFPFDRDEPRLQVFGGLNQPPQSPQARPAQNIPAPRSRALAARNAPVTRQAPVPVGPRTSPSDFGSLADAVPGQFNSALAPPVPPAQIQQQVQQQVQQAVQQSPAAQQLPTPPSSFQLPVRPPAPPLGPPQQPPQLGSLPQQPQQPLQQPPLQPPQIPQAQPQVPPLVPSQIPQEQPVSQAQARTQPQAQTQAPQQPGNASPLALPSVPDGSVEIIRGRPRLRNTFQRTIAEPNERGGFTERAPSISPTAKRLVEKFNGVQGTPEAKSVLAELTAIDPSLASQISGEADKERDVNTAREFQTREINENRRNRRDDNQRADRRSQAERAAEERKANRPVIRTVTDEFGGQSNVLINPSTGEQRPARDARATAERQIRRASPDASDEEINEYLDREFG